MRSIILAVGAMFSLSRTSSYACRSFVVRRTVTLHASVRYTYFIHLVFWRLCQTTGNSHLTSVNTTASLQGRLDGSFHIDIDDDFYNTGSYVRNKLLTNLYRLLQQCQ